MIETDNIKIIIGIITIIIAFFLILQKTSQRQSVTTDQQPTILRKFSVKTVIGVIAAVAIIGLLIGGILTNDKKIDAGSVIETGKGIITKEPEIPVFTDDFNRQNLGENWRLGTNNWVIENGELVGQKGNREKAWIHLNPVFEADELIITFDAWIESEDWKPKTEIGLYICDGSSESKYHPVLIFDGEAHICPEYNSGFRAFKPFNNPLKANKVYHITAKRIEQGKNVRLSLIVTDENGKIAEDSKTIENKGKERIKIGFFSFNFEKSFVSYENNDDKVHIANLKIYTAYA